MTFIMKGFNQEVKRMLPNNLRSLILPARLLYYESSQCIQTFVTGFTVYVVMCGKTKIFVIRVFHERFI